MMSQLADVKIQPSVGMQLSMMSYIAIGIQGSYSQGKTGQGKTGKCQGICVVRKMSGKNIIVEK